jgi:hypothetical protein
MIAGGGRKLATRIRQCMIADRLSACRRSAAGWACRSRPSAGDCGTYVCLIGRSRLEAGHERLKAEGQGIFIDWSILD